MLADKRLNVSSMLGKIYPSMSSMLANKCRDMPSRPSKKIRLANNL